MSSEAQVSSSKLKVPSSEAQVLSSKLKVPSSEAQVPSSKAQVPSSNIMSARLLIKPEEPHPAKA
ncbi:MAG: hypothetical protein V7L21_29300 [Nostoc sp.]|uniref:hypothetical protein n=1 Tax=Nostoc sp. TaxID=1180 RepID=UPI002FF8D482